MVDEKHELIILCLNIQNMMEVKNTLAYFEKA